MEKLLDKSPDESRTKAEPFTPNIHTQELPLDRELATENKRLHGVLEQFISAAGENRRAHQKFRSFELQLLSCSHLDTLFSLIIEGFIEKFELDACSLWLYDADNQVSELVNSAQISLLDKPIEIVENYQAIAKYYEHWNVRLVESCSAEQQQRFFPSIKHIASIAMMPLIRNGLIIGSLHLGSRQKDRFSPLKGTDFLEHISYIISLCIENSIHQQHLLRLSMIDMLTHAYNRRAFSENLDKELSRAERLKQPLSLLFFDIDYFKMVNDTYGHAMGDIALKEIARIAQQHLRTVDMFARYGGEEFTALLPNTHHKSALYIAERIRQAIKTTPIIDKDQVLRVTISIGLSTWYDYEAFRHNPHQIATDLLSTADEALYLAKQHGRDQVRYLSLN